mmetsp:Transcript_11745/g.18010  ORF Transcript_11745/g.18010 Transcript_11745/m.18010 type:complete len:332 (+) Transcript_11745:101-1096(+)
MTNHKLHLIDLNKADAAATETPSFAQEEHKKSSFILDQCPVNLCIHARPGDGSASNEQTQKTTPTASASISCSMGDSDETEMYLFGGFELIASIKSTEVYVTPSGSTKQEENYITTCKGIPHRDNENADLCPWYKFIFVLPGGPKPVNNVRLKFVGTNRPSSNSCTIAIRVLKLKGRLPGDMPKSKTPQSQGRSNQILAPHASNNCTGNGDAMAAMMAQMRLSSMGQEMPMMTPFSQPPSIPMQFQQHNHHSHVQQQQNSQEEKDKSQAEIISSIVGLGLFLKSSEERTINAMEKMVSGMESRIMERLDGLSARIDEIEQKYNGNDNYAQE